MNTKLIRSNSYKKIHVIESTALNDYSNKSEDFILNYLIEKTNLNKLKLKISEKKNIDIDNYIKIRLFNCWGYEIIDDHDFNNYIENDVSPTVIIFFTKSK